MQDIEAINFQPPHQESTMDIDGGSVGASTATNKTRSSKLLTAAAAAGVIFLSASTVYAAFFLASETAAKNADLIQQQQSATMGKSSKAPRATKAPKAPPSPCKKASDLFAGYWCYSNQFVNFQLYLTTDFPTEGIGSIGSLDYAVCDTYSDAADIMLTSCSSSTEIRGEIRGSINDFKYVTDNTITVSTVFGPTTYTKGRCSCMR
mmetsp:Transcript_1427/g.2543  ORF Transcript_1427/g.2543 Transcript_1427/m.2543 type:complete len:206 (-) Transcript_1427:183-800(-)